MQHFVVLRKVIPGTAHRHRSKLFPIQTILRSSERIAPGRENQAAEDTFQRRYTSRFVWIGSRYRNVEVEILIFHRTSFVKSRFTDIILHRLGSIQSLSSNTSEKCSFCVCAVRTGIGSDSGLSAEPRLVLLAMERLCASNMTISIGTNRTVGSIKP